MQFHFFPRDSYVLHTSVGHYNEIHEFHLFDSLQATTYSRTDRARGNGHKLNDRSFHLNTRKHFFTMRVTEHFHRLLVVVMEFPSSGVFKSCLNMVLGNLL